MRDGLSDLLKGGGLCGVSASRHGWARVDITEVWLSLFASSAGMLSQSVASLDCRLHDGWGLRSLSAYGVVGTFGEPVLHFLSGFPSNMHTSL